MKIKLLLFFWLFAFTFQAKSQNTPETAILFKSFIFSGDAVITDSSFGVSTPGVNYGCLAGRNRYAWAFLPVCDSVTLKIEVTGSIAGVDTLGWSIYGPFQDTIQILSQLNGLTPIDCNPMNLFGSFFDVFNPPGKGIYYFVFSMNQNSLDITLSASHLQNSGYNKMCSFCNSSYFIDDQICLVTIDSASQRNKIIFDQGDTSNINGYIIFRENSISGQYDSLTFISRDSANYYIDMTANPNARNWRYMIHKYDQCGNRLSTYYQGGGYPFKYNTLHLQQGISTNNSINLSWNNAITNVPIPGNGPFIQSFFIYRSNGVDPFTVIDSVPISLDSYTDVNPNQGLNFYQVTMKKSPGYSCSITRTNEDESKSNMISTTFTGLQEPVKHNYFKIYPNPASSSTTVEIQQNSAAWVLDVISVDGKTVYSTSGAGGGKTSIETDQFAKGFYTIKLTADGKDYYRQLVVQ